MRGSATTAFRAFLMLACSVAIPVLAIWGASWSDIAKKFQNFHCPAILNLASASPAAPTSSADAPRLASRSPTIESPPTSPVAPALPIAAAQPARPVPIPSDYGEIQERLKKAGGHVLCAGIVGKRSAIVPLFLQDGRGGRHRLRPLLRGHPLRPAPRCSKCCKRLKPGAERRCGG